MQFNDFEGLMSQPRMHKYLIACKHNTRNAMASYRTNIRLSQEIFAVMCLFEVVLRNAIDYNYRRTLGNNWLFNAAQPGGFFNAVGCEKSLESVQDVILKLGAAYNPNKAIAELTFGFWTYQFGSKQFSAGGSTLLNIFSAKPFGLNHTGVFKKLSSINRIRNRIAHHEPICFGIPLSIATTYSSQKYNQLVEVLQWMGIDTASLLYGVDHVQKEIAYINSI